MQRGAGGQKAVAVLSSQAGRPRQAIIPNSLRRQSTHKNHALLRPFLRIIPLQHLDLALQ